jgi:hypothetical protein
VGFIGNTGSWIDQITVICAKPNTDLTFTGRRSIASRGGSGGAYLESYCPSDSAISGITIARTDNYQIMQLEIRCRSVKSLNGATSIIYYGYRRGPSIGAVSPPQDCPSNELATGLNIRYGRYVNGVGLICDQYIAPTPVESHQPERAHWTQQLLLPLRSS